MSELALLLEEYLATRRALGNPPPWPETHSRGPSPTARQ